MVSLNLDSNANYNKTSSMENNQPAAKGYVHGYVLKNVPKWIATVSVGIFLSNTHRRNRRFNTYYRISVGGTAPVQRHPS